MNIIGKGKEAYDRLIAKVEALFQLSLETRIMVELYAADATKPEGPDWTYEQFFDKAGLVHTPLSPQPQDCCDTKNSFGADGGWVESPGLAVRWQKGPLIIEPGMLPWNGCYIRTLLQAAEHRIAFMANQGNMKTPDMLDALRNVQEALRNLEQQVIKDFKQGKLEGI